MPKLPRTPRAARTTSRASASAATSATSRAGATAVPAEVRERAVRLYGEQGLAAAHEATGCSKPSIRRWAKAAGVSAGNAAAVASSAAATEVSLARRRERTAAARATLVELQARIAIEASQAELVVLESLRAVAQDPDVRKPAVTPDGAEVLPASLRRLQAVLSGPRLSELVGAKTRAIHDLQLLDGQATEQPEGGLTVRFATPTPTAITAGPEGQTGGPDLRVVEIGAEPTQESA